MDSIIATILPYIAFAIACVFLFHYKKLSEMDGATGTYNKHWFMVKKNSKLVQMMKAVHRSKKQFGLLFIDMDDFKAVNDNYGHSYGDTVILKTVNSIKTLIRGRGFVVRAGGDEWIVVVKACCSVSDLKFVADKIGIKILKDTHRTVSMGGSTFDSYCEINVQNFIKEIDDKMYKAKEHKSIGRCSTVV